MQFIKATEARNQEHQNVSAPLLRGNFFINEISNNYILKIAVVGIYELFINGKRITKGYFSPFRSNPTHIIYQDTYDLTDFIIKGKNTIGIILGNGMANSCKQVWKFNVAPWNDAPSVALELTSGDKMLLNATNLVTHPSEIYFDDYYYGERIDANKKIKDWALPSFDDSDWNKVIKKDPVGTRIENVNYKPITCYEILKPVKIIKGELGYIYDFGKSVACTYNLKIKGEANKTIYVLAADAKFKTNRLYTKNLYFASEKFYQGTPELNSQCDWLTLSGKEDEFEPRFNYKGCRYIEIRGINEEEAKTVDITVFALSTLSKCSNYFKCDNEVINKLQELTLNSDFSNFLHFPTDCPQREKNGWTGDAALSAEQFMYNFNASESYKEWIKNICLAQNEEGAIPCIVPTDVWGFHWGNGPGWDNILFEGSYKAYLFSGDISILKMVHPYLIKYVKYMAKKRKPNGLFEYGLGDWNYIYSSTPIEVTDTIYCKNICDTSYKIFTLLGDKENADFVYDLAESIKNSFESVLYMYINCPSMTMTSLSMALLYGMYEGKEHEINIPWAKRFLKYRCEITNHHFDGGIFGARSTFRVLGDIGEIDTALEMITNNTYPSYKTCFLDNNLTGLGESFFELNTDVENMDEEEKLVTGSFNHHMYGDISAFFYRYLAGIKIDNVNEINFSPCISKTIKHVEAAHEFESGVFKVSIDVKDDKVIAYLDIPNGIKVNISQIDGYHLANNTIKSGSNILEYIKK